VAAAPGGRGLTGAGPHAERTITKKICNRIEARR